MGSLAETTAADVDAKLKDEEAELLKNTATKLEDFRPIIGLSKEDFEKLVAAVNESTRRNEDAALLKKRIDKLGGAVVNVASKIVQLAGKTLT
ncbi:MAG: hypothetical protein NTY77_06005 [Elusimicrobia bacterium]|nr:hypothetical protein [Elusimicrobiota bacterium]